MLLHRHLTLEPCLPRPAKEPPAGPGWVHEIKHDGFRILAWRDAKRVRLFTRHGADFTARYPQIAAAVESLPVRSCALDGEAIVVNADGLSVFNLLRYRHHDHAAVLCAFDLIELDGADLRWRPVERRKAMLADLLRGTRDGIAFNQHYAGDGGDRLRARLRARLRGDRLEAPRLDISLRPRRPLAQGQEPGGASGEREAEEDWGNRRWARGRRKTR